mmetsp:Transcript_1502/g.3420  ORF Transcript_1502/g.3420 Transcript_1502/m.3420 type:complete len:205 (-) Transcript_1502:232-846(-)
MWRLRQAQERGVAPTELRTLMPAFRVSISEMMRVPLGISGLHAKMCNNDMYSSSLSGRMGAFTEAPKWIKRRTRPRSPRKAASCRSSLATRIGGSLAAPLFMATARSANEVLPAAKSLFKALGRGTMSPWDGSTTVATQESRCNGMGFFSSSESFTRSKVARRKVASWVCFASCSMVRCTVRKASEDSVAAESTKRNSPWKPPG